MRSVVGLAILLLSSLGCTDDKPAGVDRHALLTDMAHVVIVPIYRELRDKTVTLDESVADLCAHGGEEKLAAAQEAWRSARVPLKQSEAFLFGPITSLRIDSALDFWPIRSADVEEVLAGSDALDDAAIDAFGATKKGFPVIEYLLFDPTATAAEVLERLYSAGAATRRCDYAAALAHDAAQQAATLHDAWDASGGNFARELAEAGNGSTTYAKQADALTDVANGLIGGAQHVESLKLGKPLGRQDGGVAQPDAVESPYSDESLADIAHTLEGMKSAYTASYAGTTGVSLSDAVRQVSPDLDPAIRAALDGTAADAAAIPPPLRAAVESDAGSVEKAFLSAKELFRLLAADMSGALGTTPTFSDNDGD